MNEREIEILTPLLGTDFARLVVALGLMTSTVHALESQVRDLQAQLAKSQDHIQEMEEAARDQRLEGGDANVE